MMTRVKRVLAQADVTADDIDDLARLTVEPSQGTIDAAELSRVEDVQLALLAAIVAATNIRQFGQALQALIAFVEAAQVALSDYDSGRFWHLKGVAAWRLGEQPDEAFYLTTHALNRSVAMLKGITAPHAQAYLARVFDTFGQVLQHQGLLREARLEFERSLHLRDAVADVVGAAWTRGNLGRLCIELGDFAAAAGYLARDLAVVEQLSPERTQLRAQLLSHLGTCAVEQGEVQRARDYFMRSADLAQADGDAPGLAFAALGLGRVAFQGHDLVEAERQAEAAWAYLAPSALSLDDQEGIREGIRGLVHQLKAEIRLARGSARQAVEAFQAAQACFLRTPRDSVVEMARLL
jgi:tetratricopeptide (TPR) repeat protein